MTYQQRKELLNEGQEDYVDLDEYIQYLERTGQRHEANLIRRAMKKMEENDER